MMMSSETRARLEAADDAVALARPDRFDRERELDRIGAIVPALERGAEIPLALDAQVQDASHFGAVHAFRANANGTRVATMSVIFSAFGGLVTIYGSTDFPPDRFGPLVAVLREAGYVYVDCAELSGDYDGANPRFRGTWFDRFFSYL
jgi:hypothetical protein